MNKFSTPTKKDFLKFVNNFNIFFSDKLAVLTKKNFKQLIKDLIYDRRFVITILITLLSIFAHLSTPAFYQDKWVLNKIKKQLQNEFDIELILPEKVTYSMFPIPSFYLSNVKITENGDEIGIIEKMKLCLTFNKFLEKEKINIQDIHIKNSKFELYNDNLKNLKNFLNKKINEKKLYIRNSNVFLKNSDDEVYLILTIDKTQSFYDKENLNNVVKIDGGVFNNPINLNFINDPKAKELNFELNLENIGKKIKTNLNYFNNTIIGELDLLSGSTNYLTKLEFDDDKIYLYSEKKINQNHLYLADIKLNPFYANLDINLNTLDFFDLIKGDSLFMKLILSNLINNKNLNYKINLNSNNLQNHRLLKNLVLNLNFQESKLNFDNSEIIFDENVKIVFKNTEFSSNINNSFFKGEINFKIKNSDNLYKFFQTKKNYRKKISEIKVAFNINLSDNSYSIERISIDNESNDQIQNLIKYYNKNNFNVLKRIEIKNLFNEVVSRL